MNFSALKPLRPYVLAFFLIFIIYNILLAAVYSIESPKLEHNVSEGHAFIENEKEYLNLFKDVSENPFKSYAFRLDTFSDRVMLHTLMPNNKSLSPWEAALEMNNYSRYWHGYTVILRPLMTIFNYPQLRLLNVFLITVFTLISAWLLVRNINIQAAIAFIFSLFCVKIFIVPLCLTFCSMFYVFFVFLFALFLAAKWQREPFLKSQFFSLFIFILGAVTVFVDFISTPLLPVGLLLAIACIWDYEKYNIVFTPWEILRLFLVWCAGYVVIFSSKWILATVILRKNIISDAINQIIFRVHGDVQGYHMDSFTALKHSLWCVFSPFNVFWLVMIALLSGIGVLFMMYKGFLTLNKNFSEGWKLYGTLLFIGCAPFVWTLVFVNHSQIHHWLTYRIFAITIFVVTYILLKSVIFPARNFQGIDSNSSAEETYGGVPHV